MWLDPHLQKALAPQDGFDDVLALRGEMYRDFQNRKTLKFVRGGRAYFIKMHLGFGWKAIVKTVLRGGWPVIGARTEKKAIEHLTHIGVPTMKMVGFGERGANPAHKESFVITEELDRCLSLEDVAKNPSLIELDVVKKRQLIRRVALMAKKMHESGMNHRDFYLCHFLLDQSKRGDWPHLFLIDLHRAQIRLHTPKRWKIKDLGALCFSAFDAPLTQRDYYRFIKVYTGRPLRESLIAEEALWSQVMRRARKMHGRFLKKFA